MHPKQLKIRFNLFIKWWTDSAALLYNNSLGGSDNHSSHQMHLLKDLKKPQCKTLYHQKHGLFLLVAVCRLDWVWCVCQKQLLAASVEHEEPARVQKLYIEQGSDTDKTCTDCPERRRLNWTEFRRSRLSSTSDSNHQLISRDSVIWKGCVK